VKHAITRYSKKQSPSLFIVVILVLSSVCGATAKAAAHVPLPGEIAPLISLQLRASQGNKVWQSGEQLGKSALVYLLIPDRYNVSKLVFHLPPVREDIHFYAVLHNARKINLALPSAWQLLQDDRQLLSACYAPHLTQPTAVVIDKSGFVRLIQIVAGKADWQKVLSVLGQNSQPLQVGKKAPDFIIRDMNGVTRSLHQLRGKCHLLLTFFPKCFTFTCGMQLSSLRDSWPALQANHLEVWGVSVDEASGPRGQKAFADYLHLPFPLLPDPGHQLCLRYGSVVSPDQMSSRMSILIDKNGIVRWIDKQIDPRHYGDDVLAKMRELQMG
jgi:peroxiredoxin (alkyl hydroperoxide reductase subunit C)